MSWHYVGFAGLAVLTACASVEDDYRGTIKSLEARHIDIERETLTEANREKAISAYRSYLEIAPEDDLRPEAMRRLGDLELEQSEDRQLAGTPGATPKAAGPEAGRYDYRHAVKLYRDLLQAYPNYPGNDRVMYQLARTYEQTGDLDQSLATLDRLVARYPASKHREEAQFRRGELLFTMKNYAKAEEAYAAITHGSPLSPYYERALYMHGWSRFKQVHYEDGLHSFFAVLDRKLPPRDSGAPLNELAGLSRADRELVVDTFRVVSLSLSALQGPESIPRYFADTRRRRYEFRVYQELGNLYLKQERIKDAADTFTAFARRYPTHPRSPMLQVRVIEAYQKAGFAALALETKKEFVDRYGVHSAYRQANDPAAYARVAPLVKAHLEELARHYHATAQKTKNSADYSEAARWYRAFLDSFPTDAQAPAMNFLLAEILFEDKRYAEAAAEYERTAYEYPRHTKSADAGYAALLAFAEQEKDLAGSGRHAVHSRTIESGLRFAETYPNDSRAPGVLTDAAEKLYALHAPDRAAAVARRVLALAPPASAAQRRTAWTVLAHTEFERGAFDRAEAAYREVIALTEAQDSHRGALVERLAASIYRQGEQARATGNLRNAAAHFLRVGKVAPASPIRATAEYDAAAALIGLKDWNGAVRVLEHFRQAYPKHALQPEVTSKLALCYLESGQHMKAAAELEAVAGLNKDQAVSREALWQAAELYEKAARATNASAAYERYLQRFPQPLNTAIEARHRLANLSKARGETARYHHWLRELIKADQRGGAERTDRTRFLAATATMALAEPVDAAYRTVKLVEPLKKSLKAKKEKMQQAIEAYALAANYGVAEVATAATFRTAELYNDFARALLGSQRPKGLSAEELEQYNVLLEEQAFPFEEKAIELHEVNVSRVAAGIYDEWVKRSFGALGKLRPVRYAKVEKSETVIEAIR